MHAYACADIISLTFTDLESNLPMWVIPTAVCSGVIIIIVIMTITLILFYCYTRPISGSLRNFGKNTDTNTFYMTKCSLGQSTKSLKTQKLCEHIKQVM